MSTINANSTIIFSSFTQCIVDGTSTTLTANQSITINNNGSGKLLVTFQPNIIANNLNNFFICGTDNITFDGQNNLIRVDVNSYTGLIQNGTVSVSSTIADNRVLTSGKNNITIQNIGITTANANVFAAERAGYIAQQGFAGNALNNIINNCYSTGSIRNFAGGICGAATAINGNLTISNCYSIGNNDQFQAGGICGWILGNGSQNNTISIINCYSRGIIGNQSGGIIGSNAANNSNFNLIINNCFSTGGIAGPTCGGIVGASLGTNSLRAITISNCYSLGNFTNSGSGIVGSWSGGTLNISNCYFNGAANGSSSAGIINGGGVVNINNCYTLSLNVSITLGTFLGGNRTNNYQVNGQAWSDSTANSILTTGTTPLNTYTRGTVWTSVQANTPYLLSSYNNIQTYNPNGSTIFPAQGTTFNSLPGTILSIPYTLLSVNDLQPPLSITINSSSGILSFTNLDYTDEPVYISNIFTTSGTSPNFNGYNFGNYTLSLLLDPPSTISANSSIVINNTQYSVDNGPFTNFTNFPVIITNNNPSAGTLVVYFESGITYNVNSKYYICGSDNITFDGQNNEINITAIDWLGLILNGTVDGDVVNTSGKNNITIQNIGITTSGAGSLSIGGGYITQQGFAGNALNNVINNCYSTGTINGIWSGGICGYANAINGILVSITNCYTTGIISGDGAGGICGKCFAVGESADQNVNISNCYSTGTISGYESGGICGSSSGAFGGTFLVNKCYTIGNITGSESGGILGHDSAYDTSKPVTITECYSIGNISGYLAAGICGGRTGYDEGVLNIINCYSTGSVTNGGQGIVGQNSGGTNVSITNSYCLNGDLIDIGGNITYCYNSLGTWSDSTANTSLNSQTTPPNTYTKGSVWTSVQSNTPYLLSSYNTIQTYIPENTAKTDSSQGNSYITQPGVFTTPYQYKLISVNNAKTPTYEPNITIDTDNGIIIFSDLFNIYVKNKTYVANVFSTLDSTTLLSSSISSTSNTFYDYNFSSFILNAENLRLPISDICFPKNTLINLDQGIIPIQKINPSIHTIDNKKIIAITKTISEQNHLIYFKKNSLGNNYPNKETAMSRDHKILYNGRMIEAYHFLNNFENVKKIEYNGEPLYNILMEKYDTIKVNNLICETLHPENFISKIYKSEMTNEYKNKIIILLNNSILRKDYTTLKKITNYL